MLGITPKDSDARSRGNIPSPYAPWLGRTLLLVPILVTWAHVFISPYTKVEESFTLHAIHDVLAHGFDIDKWDHVQFPGAVPRSFVLPIYQALISWPVVKLCTWAGVVKTKLGIQVLIRLVLATSHSVSSNELQKAIAIRYGQAVGIWFVLLNMTQFHIPYYAGRTLPNFLALPLVYTALAWLIHSAPLPAPAPVNKGQLASRRNTGLVLHDAIVRLVMVATLVRLELALFILPTVLSLWIRDRRSLLQIVIAGMAGGLGSLLFAGPIDYALWHRALPHPSLPTFSDPSLPGLEGWKHAWKIIWPELGAAHYNAVLGHAAKWGVMSRDYYFTNSLPKLCMTSIPLFLAGLVWMWAGKLGLMVLQSQMVAAFREVGDEWTWGFLGLVGGLSCVGHKEWRFIVYAVPIVNTLAAISAAFMWTSSPPRIRPLIRLGLLGALAVNAIATAGMTYVSSINYPGGQVWEALEELQAGSDKRVAIHFSPYPLSTGTTLFTFLHADPPTKKYEYLWFSTIPSPIAAGPVWYYSKDEDPALLTPQGARAAGMDYIVLGTDEVQSGGWLEEAETEDETETNGVDGRGDRWEVVRRIKGYSGIQRQGFRVGVRLDDKVVILARGRGSVGVEP